MSTKVHFHIGSQESYNPENFTAGSVVVTDAGRMYIIHQSEGGQRTNYLIGENLDKINVGANNVLLGNNCSAIGTDNIAGSKGYRIVQVVAHSGTQYDVCIEVSESTIQHTLDTLNSIIEQSEGNYNRVGIRLSNHYQGTLMGCTQKDSTHIDLTIDFYKTIPTSLATDSDGNPYKTGDYNTLFLLSYPDIGEEVIHNYCFAEGYMNTASGNYSTVLSGYGNTAWGKYSVAEGVQNEAGYAGHVEGRLNKANGESAHAQNHGNEASGGYSDATGLWTTSKGRATTSIGKGTIATSEGSLALGRFNEEDNEDRFVLTIGNGRSSKDSGSREDVLAAASRSNAHTVDWHGNAWYSGDVYVGGNYAYDKGEGIVTDAKRLATLDDVDALAKSMYVVDLTCNIPAKTPLFKFTTNASARTGTVSIAAQCFFAYNGKHVDFTYTEPISYEYGSTGAVKALIYDHSKSKISDKLSIVSVKSIGDMKKTCSILLMFNGQPSQLTSPANVSYKGVYEYNGVLYNYVPSSKEAALLKKDIIKYVSTSGKETNTGDTSSAPYNSIQKAIDSGATIIHVATGEYIETITSTSAKHKLHILGGWTGNSSNLRSKVVINCGKSISLTSGDSSGLLTASYTSAESSMMYKAFVSKSEELTGTKYYSSGRSAGYVVNLWKKGNTIQSDLKLTPVLSLDLCKSTSNSWYYDGSKIYANTTGTDFVLSSGDYDGIKLSNIDDLVLEDIEVRYPFLNGFNISKCNNVKVTSCGATHAGLRNGFYIEYTNGNFNGCYSHKNRNDGYGIAAFGHTVFTDCEANYNYDDGVSHHAGCTGTVTGGKYVGNAKGGVAPAHGAIVNCYNVSCSDNRYGFYCVDTESNNYGRAYTLNGCVAHNNSSNDILIDNYHITAYNCIYDSVSYTSNATTSLTCYDSASKYITSVLNTEV